MVIVYVLKSLKTGRRYVGITNKVGDRLARHNGGRNFSTKGRGPFKIIRSEEFSSYIEAREREKFLKSGAGRKLLDNLTS